MRITNVRIRDFRGIQSLEVDLNETTVFIGENNSGKTSVLDALRLCLRELGPRRRVVFDSFDFHLKDYSAEPSSADPLCIEISFSEQSEDEWASALIGRLNRQKILQIDGSGARHVVLRVTCVFDPTSRDFSQEWNFLNLDGQPLAAVSERALGTLQREIRTSPSLIFSGLAAAPCIFSGPALSPSGRASSCAPVSLNSRGIIVPTLIGRFRILRYVGSS